VAEGDVTIKDEVAAWGGATDKIREVVKWIATSFGALGALLIGTAPLSGLSKLDVVSWRFAWVAVFGLLALGGVAYVVWRATSLLTPSTVTMVDVESGAEFSALRAAIAAEPAAYLGTWGTDVTTFVTNRDKEYTLFAAVDHAIAQSPDSAELTALREARKGLIARIESMGRISARVLAAAGFHDLATRFAAARRWMFLAAAVTVVGITGFVLAVGGAGTESSDTVAYVPARVSLTDAGTKALGPLLGASCPQAFEALVLSGGADGPWDLLVTDEHCTSGELTVEKTDGRVLLVFDR